MRPFFPNPFDRSVGIYGARSLSLSLPFCYLSWRRRNLLDGAVLQWIFSRFFTAKMSRITRILVRPWVFNLSECRCWKRQCFYDELCHFQNMGISQRAYFIVCSCAVMIMKPFGHQHRQKVWLFFGEHIFIAAFI